MNQRWYQFERDAQLQPTNVYGRTKLMIEEMLSDYGSIYGSTYVALRYFNAASADPSGTIGEDHHPETHLIPLFLMRLVVKESTLLFLVLIILQLMVHVCAIIFMLMIAAAHVLAMDYLRKGRRVPSI